MCPAHGGKAPQVSEAARKRILAALLVAADPASVQLIKLATSKSKKADPRVQLLAIRDLLNRAGIVPDKAAEIPTGNGQVLWEEFVQIHRRVVAAPEANVPPK